MLLHQGIALDVFNELPTRKAVHALYECCNSVALSCELAQSRPYASRDQLFRRADALLFAASEEAIDSVLEAYPPVGVRPRSTRAQGERCSVWDEGTEAMAELNSAARHYAAHFGFDFVMFVGDLGADEVLLAIEDRIHNHADIERKVLRNELAKLNRARLERMLGPEGGYDNW
jgi:OHCU decarboxylase